MKSFIKVALSAAFLAGCGAPPQVATPDKGRVVTDAVLSPFAATVAKPDRIVGDAVLSPVAGKAPVAEAKTPAAPTSLAEMGQAFKIIREGMVSKSGKAFDPFEVGEVPAHAITVPDESLKPSTGYGVQAQPETTQDKADKEALKWAGDAKQIYVGWGFAGRWAPLAMFGQSRHVYYSVDKTRLLYLDYNFFRFTKSRWESDDIILKFAGKYISWVLTEPRGRYPYNGLDAFNQASKYGYAYQNRPKATIKAICIHPIFVGPKWVFFDSIGRPAMVVDAATGETTWDGLLLDILKLLFTFNP